MMNDKEARANWNKDHRCHHEFFYRNECAQEIEGPHFLRCHRNCWMFTAEQLDFLKPKQAEPSYADFYR